MLSHTNPSTVLLVTCLLQHNAAALSIASSIFLISPPPFAHSLSETETQPPSQNLLTYLSTTHIPDTSTPKLPTSLCTSFLSRDKTALLLPNARIPLSPAGFIDCFLEPQAQGSQAEDNHKHQKQQLVFKGIPAGWQFSITEITVAGWLDLERGSFVERVEVGVGYPDVVEVKMMEEESVSVKESTGTGNRKTQGKKDGGGDQAWVEGGDGYNGGHGEAESDKGWKWKWGLKREIRKTRRETQATQATQTAKSQSQGLIDTATSLTPYGRFGTGYQGTFNLSMPVKPTQSNPKASVFRSSSTSSSTSTDKGKRDQLAVSPCSTGPEMEIALGAELWFSLSNEQIEFDDTIVHRGRLGGEDGEDGEGEGEGEGEGKEGDEEGRRWEKTLRVGVRGEWKRC